MATAGSLGSIGSLSRDTLGSKTAPASTSSQRGFGTLPMTTLTKAAPLSPTANTLRGSLSGSEGRIGLRPGSGLKRPLGPGPMAEEEHAAFVRRLPKNLLAVTAGDSSRPVILPKKETLQASVMLKDMVGDTSTRGKVAPISEVDRETMLMLKDWIQHKQWRKEWDDLTITADILKAANFMNIPELIDLSAKKVAGWIEVTMKKPDGKNIVCKTFDLKC